MGEIKAKVRLVNLRDTMRFEDGNLPEDRVRVREIEAVADTGAVLTLLPQDLVEALGLKTLRRVVVQLANDQKIELDLAGGLELTVAGRTVTTDCLVGPPGCTPLIGQIVMEALDLIADPVKRTLTVRPESPYLPTLNLKRLLVPA